jgi:hypothetical protein
MRSLSASEIESVSGGDLSTGEQIGLGLAAIGLGVAIVGTGGLAGLPVATIIGAGTAGEILTGLVGAGLAGAGGILTGLGIGELF